MVNFACTTRFLVHYKSKKKRHVATTLILLVPTWSIETNFCFLLHPAGVRVGLHASSTGTKHVVSFLVLDYNCNSNLVRLVRTRSITKLKIKQAYRCTI